SPRPPRAGLRLVHRRLQHARSERGEGAAGRAEVNLRGPSYIVFDPCREDRKRLGDQIHPSRAERSSGANMPPNPAPRASLIALLIAGGGGPDPGELQPLGAPSHTHPAATISGSHSTGKFTELAMKHFSCAGLWRVRASST